MTNKVLDLLSPKDIQRFWSKVDKTAGNGPDGDCWLWKDVPAGNGYGYLGVGGRRGRKIQAHQIAYEIAHGPIPVGLQPDHKCRIRRCVNPFHLEAVTGRENTLRGNAPSAIHARATQCPHGHLYDAKNTIRRKNGRRECRACKSRLDAAYKLRTRYTTAMAKRGDAINDILEMLRN